MPQASTSGTDIEHTNEASVSLETVIVNSSTLRMQGASSAESMETVADLMDSDQRADSPTPCCSYDERSLPFTRTGLASLGKNNGGVDTETNATVSKTRGRQAFLSYNCKACENMQAMWKGTSGVFQKLASNEIRKRCQCNSTDCCYTKTLESLTKPSEENEVSKKSAEPETKKELLSHFFCEEIGDGRYRYFCKICLQYSSKVQLRHKATGDWVFKGHETIGKIRITQPMKRHLDKCSASRCIKNSRAV